MISYFTISIGLFGVACLVTFLATFPFRILAKQLALVDRPDNFRKLHQEPIPVGGGAVLFLVFALCLGCLIFLNAAEGFGAAPFPITFLSAPLLSALAIVVPFLLAIGLVDDKRGLGGRSKLFCQLVTATVIVACSDFGTRVACFGCEADLSWGFYPLAVFGIVGMINAMNLLDGADGVAVTTSFFITAAVTGIALLNGRFEFALLGIALVGCLIGFFPHNWPSARIYLGDSGSMFLGLITGTLLLHSGRAPDGAFHFVGPMAVILIPMTDSLMAVIRRLNAGRSIFISDRGHVHHLLAMRFSPGWPVLAVLCLLIVPGCLGGVLGTYFRNDFLPLGISLAVLTVAASADLFGRRELLILYGRVHGWFLKTFKRRDYVRQNGEAYHVQGRGPWLEMWSRIVTMLKDYPCRHLKLDINIPFRNENFYGEWSNIADQDPPDAADMDFSFFFNDGRQRIGVLRLSFDGRNRDHSELMGRVDEVFGICGSFVTRCLTSESWDAGILPLPDATVEPAVKKEAS